jgi:hypothetical protein
VIMTNYRHKGATPHMPAACSSSFYTSGRLGDVWETMAVLWGGVGLVLLGYSIVPISPYVVVGLFIGAYTHSRNLEISKSRVIAMRPPDILALQVPAVESGVRSARPPIAAGAWWYKHLKGAQRGASPSALHFHSPGAREGLGTGLLGLEAGGCMLYAVWCMGVPVPGLGASRQ